MKTWLTTFGSTDKFSKSLQYFQQVGPVWFDRVRIFTEHGLIQSNDCPEQIKNKLNPSRGFGYWIWRAYILKNVFEQMNDNDVLLAIDCGSRFNLSYRYLLDEYIEDTKNYPIYMLNSTSYIKYYTKRDVLDYFNIDLNDSDFLNKIQFGGTLQMFRKNNVTCRYVNDFFNIAVNRPDLFTDDDINNEQLSTFIDKRHDQSIQTLLVYTKYNNDWAMFKEIDGRYYNGGSFFNNCRCRE